MKIRTLIADDERLARKRLRRLLQFDPDIDIVGECEDGLATADALREVRPDLLFLDIQMPGSTGFEVLERVSGGEYPVIVFVTAYDNYAIKAFEVQAQDYLLKPFDRARFQKCLRQAKEQVARRRASDTGRQLAQVIESLKPGPQYLNRLVVKSGGRIVFLKTVDVDYIEAADNYVRLHVGSESHLLRETMNALEDQLDPARFVRIHRSAIVNVDRIEQLQPWFRGDYLVMLRGGKQLTLSRGYRERVESVVGHAF